MVIGVCESRSWCANAGVYVDGYARSDTIIRLRKNKET